MPLTMDRTTLTKVRIQDELGLYFFNNVIAMFFNLHFVHELCDEYVSAMTS